MSNTNCRHCLGMSAWPLAWNRKKYSTLVSYQCGAIKALKSGRDVTLEKTSASYASHKLRFWPNKDLKFRNIILPRPDHQYNAT